MGVQGTNGARGELAAYEPCVPAEVAPAGNRLMSADENGVFAVWKVDSRCQLTLSTQYARQGSFTHCVFATLPASRDNNAKR